MATIVSTTAERLKYLLESRKLKQIDVVKMCKPYCKKMKVRIEGPDMSQWVSGKVQPNQTKLYILAKVFNVSEAWLMGYDVEMKSLEITDDKYSEIVEEFIELRKKNNLSVSDLANKVHLSEESIRSYETGDRKPPISVIQRMAKYYNVDDSSILGYKLSAKADEEEASNHLWNEQFENTEFTEDEINELVSFANYLISKRQSND